MAKASRYHRTVRVTAAIYSDFENSLPRLLYHLEHWAVCTPSTSRSRFAGSYVFAKQSYQPFLCHSWFLHPESSFSFRYRVILPSSLEVVPPFALMFLHLSTCVGFLYGPFLEFSFLGSFPSLPFRFLLVILGLSHFLLVLDTLHASLNFFPSGSRLSAFP